MIFSDLYKSPRFPLTVRRRSKDLGLPPDLDLDLISKDKARQKAAVKRFLRANIRNDWRFTPRKAPVVSIRRSRARQSSPTSPSPAPSAAAPAAASHDHLTPSSSAKPAAQNDAPQHVTVAPAPVSVPVSASEIATASATEPSALATAPAPTPAAPTVVSPPESQELASQDDADSDDAESVYSSVTEDSEHWVARAEWASDVSDDEDPSLNLDSPFAAAEAVAASTERRRAKQRRALRDEMAWNDGVAYFEARRDAWTGARTVRVHPKQEDDDEDDDDTASPPPASPRLSSMLWRRLSRSEVSDGTISPTSIRRRNASRDHGPASRALSPATTISRRPSIQFDAPDISPESLSMRLRARDEQAKLQLAAVKPATSRIETLLPIPAPLLPPSNPMRASITPALYESIYDRVIVNNQQPSCPINLGDIVRATVSGWKRDGQWPPKLTAPQGPSAAAAAKSAAAANATSGAAAAPSAPAIVVQEPLLRPSARKSIDPKSDARGDSGFPSAYSRKSSVGTIASAYGPQAGRRVSLPFLQRRARSEERQAEGRSRGSSTRGFRRSLQKVLGLGHPTYYDPVQGRAKSVGSASAAHGEDALPFA